MLDAPTMTHAQALDVLRPHAPFSVEAFYRRSYEETVFVKTQAGKTIMAIDNPFGEAFAVILNGADAQAAEIERLRCVDEANAKLVEMVASRWNMIHKLREGLEEIAAQEPTFECGVKNYLERVRGIVDRLHAETESLT